MKDIDRIEKNSEKVTESGCWIWMGAVTGSGYGVCGSQKNKTRSAHRVSYEAFIGEIPKGMIIAHSCDIPLCVNPNHLWVATHKENSQDMVKKNRQAKGEAGGNTKLTLDQIEFIRKSILPHRKLGRMFNVSHANIGYIKRGFTWKN
jgi:hypothetical protein